MTTTVAAPDAAAEQGDNLLVASARTPLRIVWRSYDPEALLVGYFALEPASG